MCTLHCVVEIAPSKTMLVKSWCNAWRPILTFYSNIFFHLSLFLLFFGIPSIEKYLAQETFVTYSEEDSSGIEAPAVTFVAVKANGTNVVMGWKTSGEIKDYQRFRMVDHCDKIGLTNLETCVLNDTFMSQWRLSWQRQEWSVKNIIFVEQRHGGHISWTILHFGTFAANSHSKWFRCYRLQYGHQIVLHFLDFGSRPKLFSLKQKSIQPVS